MHGYVHTLTFSDGEDDNVIKERITSAFRDKTAVIEFGWRLLIVTAQDKGKGRNTGSPGVLLPMNAPITFANLSTCVSRSDVLVPTNICDGLGARLTLVFVMQAWPTHAPCSLRWSRMPLTSHVGIACPSGVIRMSLMMFTRVRWSLIYLATR